MLEVQVLRVLQCAFNRFLHSGSIFRVKTFEEQLQRRLYRSLILKNPKVLIGPVEVSGRNVPAEAPRTAKRLRLRKVGFPTLQFQSQPLLLGNVQGRTDEACDESLPVHRLAHAIDESNSAVRVHEAILNVNAS